MSAFVWWMTAGLLALAVVLLVAALAVLAVAAFPRRASVSEELEHEPVLTSSGEAAAATDRLVDLVAAWHTHAETVARGLFFGTVLLAVAGVAACVMGGVFAVGDHFYDPPSAVAATPQPDGMVTAAAPRVWLHPAERYGPIDPAAVLRHSSLRWRRKGPDVTIDPQPVRTAGLGATCGGRVCRTYGPYLPSQLTRPNDSATELRPKRLPLSRGMYIEVPDNLRRGELLSQPPVPAFYEINDGKPREITYWFFFGASRRFARPPRKTREGDWERFVVRLDEKGKPTAVLLPSSESPVAWADLEKTKDGHAVLYASLERHALFATPCPQPRTSDTCKADPRAAGLRWDTWTNLRDVTKEPWYGFGGAWGHAGARTDLTGPLGPRSAH